MAHFLITQLQFAKQQWLAGHIGLKPEDAHKRVGQSNSISWMVAHLAAFDQKLWWEQRGGNPALNDMVKQCSYGQPASIPDFGGSMAVWQTIQDHIDPILLAITAEDLGKPHAPQRNTYENTGTLILRQTWHYWYHLGEMQSIRQALGHKNLQQYVGRIPFEAQWT